MAWCLTKLSTKPGTPHSDPFCSNRINEVVNTPMAAFSAANSQNLLSNRLPQIVNFLEQYSRKSITQVLLAEDFPGVIEALGLQEGHVCVLVCS